jgi:urease accessory protein
MITVMPTITPTMAGTDEVPQALLRLFRLVSPALPVGAYAYSQGLEYAVHAGWVRDEATTFDWLDGLARSGVGTLDLPLLLRLHDAWSAEDSARVRHWTAQLIASRETAELRAEELHLGRALARVLPELGIAEAVPWRDAARDAARDAPHDTTWDARPAYATMFGLAAARWRVSPRSSLLGYLWAWSENQVLAALKLVPLGQSAGLRVLDRLSASMPEIVEHALGLPDRHIGVGALSQAYASALHESQYSRLFRS